MKPKIKTVYPVYRVREDLLRIGAEPGITADVEESHGEMARFLSLLDGQKDIKEVTRAMQEEYPEITEQDVLEGIQALASLGLLVNGEHAPHKLSDRDLERHSRNLNFFEHFADLETSKYSFQEKLRESTVTIIGAGGHGSSIAFQLAALGVGKLRLIDGDVVELSNLNRQVFFREKDVGRPKVFALAQHLKEFYSDLKIQTINGFAYQGLDKLIRGSDLVICAADQPYAQIDRWVNEACVRERVPCIFTAHFIASGRVYSVDPKRNTGCIDCMILHFIESDPDFENQFWPIARHRSASPPQAAAIPNVFMLTGLVVLEALRYLTAISEPMSAGRMLKMDFLQAKTEVFFDWPKSPHCATCNDGTNEPHEFFLKLERLALEQLDKVAVGE